MPTNIHDTTGHGGNGQDGLLRQILTELRRLTSLIEGDGTDDHPGFRLRIDRLERAMVERLPERIASLEFQSRILWAALTVAILALVALGWNQITEGKGAKHTEAETLPAHTRIVGSR